MTLFDTIMTLFARRQFAFYLSKKAIWWLWCNCEESKPETDSVSSCYVGDEQIEKQEVITKCAEHTDEFETGPYMCGVRKLIKNDFFMLFIFKFI